MEDNQNPRPSSAPPNQPIRQKKKAKVSHGATQWTLFVSAMRWPDGVKCPHCKSPEVSYLSTRYIWKCMNRECRRQFSVRTGTILEDSPLNLRTWMIAIWEVVNRNPDMTSYTLADYLGVTQTTAWKMKKRIMAGLKQKPKKPSAKRHIDGKKKLALDL